jgi:hypothetical protein
MTTLPDSTTLWCPMCGGVSHPATGCAYSATFVVCWACTLEFCRWLEKWTARRKRRPEPSFYEHVRYVEEDR